MLELSETDLLNRGANRACYRHPDEPGRCIKIDLPDGVGMRLGLNDLEFEHHRGLAERLGEGFYAHAPRCYGWLKTSLGPGLCFELVCNADGSRSRRLQDVIDEGQHRQDEVLGWVDRLRVFVRDNRVTLFDLNLHNLLVREEGSGGVGGVDLVAIDWKGPKAVLEAIPVSAYLPFIARRKVARRFTRLREQIVWRFKKREGFAHGVGV
ncbi:MAG: YrbL family protein [Planctomycetota bacterium]